MVYWIGYFLTQILCLIYCPRKIYGKENIPARGGFILASNHISNVDPNILGSSFFRRLSYVAKESLFKNKFLSFMLHQVGAFPINRDTADLGAIKETLRRLKQGSPVLIFPEGTRTREASSREVQAGIGLIAVKSGVPVIPAFVEDSDKVMPPGSKFFKRHLVKVYFGKPLYFTKGQPYQDIAQQIMAAILSLPGQYK